MGGAGYIFTGLNDANVMTNSALINLKVAKEAVKKKVQKVFEMLAELFEFKSKDDFLYENISVHLKSITSRNLTSKLIRKLNE
jgi:hypothetical protein